MPITENFDIFVNRYYENCQRENQYKKVIRDIKFHTDPNKKNPSLIGTLIKYLIENNELTCIDYNRLRKSKPNGIWSSCFNTIKSNMMNTNGHPWFKEHQDKYGNIIKVNSNKTIELTDTWKQIIQLL